MTDVEKKLQDAHTTQPHIYIPCDKHTLLKETKKSSCAHLDLV